MPPRKKQPATKDQSSKRYLTGATSRREEDSDDQSGDEDEPWSWIYADIRAGDDADNEDTNTESGNGRQNRKTQEKKIIGARHGEFRCKVGDCVALKHEGSEGWAGIIRNFSLHGEDMDMGADIMCKVRCFSPTDRADFS